MSEHPYYQRIASPTARIILRLAMASLPLMAVGFLLALATGLTPTFNSVASGYYILAVVCTPALLLYAVAQLFPKNFRVVCLHCSWFRDYAYRRGPLEAADDEPATAA